MPSPRRIPAGVFFALGVVALLACTHGHDKEDDNQFREDVIQCEEAVARLDRCCPSFDASRVLCNYYFSYDEAACSPPTTRRVSPALDLEESRCVIDTSCEDLVANGVCQRAQEAGTYSSTSVAGDGGRSETNTHPAVCR